MMTKKRSDGWMIEPNTAPTPLPGKMRAVLVPPNVGHEIARATVSGGRVFVSAPPLTSEGPPTGLGISVPLDLVDELRVLAQLEGAKGAAS